MWEGHTFVEVSHEELQPRCVAFFFSLLSVTDCQDLYANNRMERRGKVTGLIPILWPANQIVLDPAKDCLLITAVGNERNGGGDRRQSIQRRAMMRGRTNIGSLRL